MAERSSSSSPIGWGSIAVLAGLVVAIGALIFWGTTLNSGESRYGTIDIPGSAEVKLPAGRLDLTFTMDLANQTVAIPVLRLHVAPLDGGPAPTVRARIGTPNADNGVTHVRVGTVRIATPGTYRVTVDGAGTASPAPELHLGAVPDRIPLLIGGLVLGPLLIIAGIVGIVTGARRPGRPGPAT